MVKGERMGFQYMAWRTTAWSYGWYRNQKKKKKQETEKQNESTLGLNFSKSIPREKDLGKTTLFEREIQGSRVRDRESKTWNRGKQINHMFIN